MNQISSRIYNLATFRPGPRPPAPRPPEPRPPAPRPPEPHPPGPHPPHPHPPDPDPHPPHPHPPEPWPPPQPGPWPGPDPNPYAPLTVDATPIQDANGNPVAVTSISIQQSDDPNNGAGQNFDANDPEERQVTLTSGEPNEYYMVGVNWADGSSYQAQVPDYQGGNYVSVTGPNTWINQTADPSGPDVLARVGAASPS
ncbi:MAG: hypothetical protein ACYCW6_06355 [Candidatus Xenobia bacterium]